MNIPFSKASAVGNEILYIKQAIENGQISGDGHFTKLCNAELEKLTGCKKALMTTSCTHSLDMSAMLLDIQPEDKFILPSFTFVSTVNAFVLRGAKPIFCEIRPDTLNIDEKKIETAITARTKAIVVVHYAGVGCEMNAIMSLAKKYKIAVIEDNAHGLFGKYQHQWLGSFGCLSAQSFHETKNISCGEGGALLINDPDLIERAEIIREKGTNRSRFFRGQVDKYTWVDVGSSYLPSDILAAILFSQLAEADEIQQTRKAIWERYFSGLEQWANQHAVALPFVPQHCEQSYHMFYVMLQDLRDRDRFIGYLKDRSINAVFHYVPLHTSEMGEKFGYIPGQLPVTETVSDRLVRLPFFNDLSIENQEIVIGAICSFQ